MTDDHIRENCYLVTHKWCHPDPNYTDPHYEWKEENSAIRGCPGKWWAEYLAKAEELVGNSMFDYMEQRAKGGAPIKPAEYLHRFVCATPITREGYEALTKKA